MASFFILELDTTSPKIDIYAPSYTLRGTDNYIEVVANEQLGKYQDIYIIDSIGDRHDVIFSHEGDRFTGVVNFDNYPVGSATIYATVKDTVNNISQQIYTIIEILSDGDALRLKMSIGDNQMESLISDIGYDHIVSDFDPTI